MTFCNLCSNFNSRGIKWCISSILRGKGVHFLGRQQFIQSDRSDGCTDIFLCGSWSVITWRNSQKRAVQSTSSAPVFTSQVFTLDLFTTCDISLRFHVNFPKRDRSKICFLFEREEWSVFLSLFYWNNFFIYCILCVLYTVFFHYW